jgi:hypothetical protein
MDLYNALLEVLRQEVGSGRIGCFGIGGEPLRGPDLYICNSPTILRVDAIQLKRVFARSNPLFRLFTAAREVHRALTDHADIRKRWSEEADKNLAERSILVDAIAEGGADPPSQQNRIVHISEAPTYPSQRRRRGRPKPETMNWSSSAKVVAG